MPRSKSTPSCGWLLINSINRNTPQGGDMRMHEKNSSPFSYALGVITTAAGALFLGQCAPISKTLTEPVPLLPAH